MAFGNRLDLVKYLYKNFINTSDVVEDLRRFQYSIFAHFCLFLFCCYFCIFCLFVCLFLFLFIVVVFFLASASPWSTESGIWPAYWLELIVGIKSEGHFH